MNKKAGKIYFVTAPGRIKIGFTTKPEARLAQLRRMDMEELKVIATVDSFKWVELKLHELALPYRIKGEWFTDCPEVRAVVDGFISGALTFEAPFERPDKSHLVFNFFEQKQRTLDFAIKESIWIGEEIGRRIERRENISDLVREALFLAEHIIGPALHPRAR
jgi:hypothetical protein